MLIIKFKSKEKLNMNMRIDLLDPMQNNHQPTYKLKCWSN